ncbi:Btz domain - like 3 [Theobroma cacao]|nr:Btz domain - like 3 [Theobroma cacao]
MENSGEVEAQYESEPDESLLLRRRREASDDDKEVEMEENKMPVRFSRSVRRTGCADESDGGSGAPEFYEDDDDEEGSYVHELEKLGEEVEEEREEEVAKQVTSTKQRGKEKVNDADIDPFAVPRTGAFYMHDDRFGGLRRRSRDQRRKKYIWESKDELKWMHDKFEEMTLEKPHNNELNAFEVHRTSKGHQQGRNKDNTKSGGYKAKDSRPHSKSGSNGSSSKIVKGRGPVRYKPLLRSSSVNSPMKSMQFEKTQGTSSKTSSARVISANNRRQYKRLLGKTSNADSSERALSIKCKQPAKPFEMTRDMDSSTVFSTKSKYSGDLQMVSYIDPASVSFHRFNADSDSLPFDQHLLVANMSSYLQAFYPASSFNLDNSRTQKRMVLPGSRNVTFPASVQPNQIIHVPQSNEYLPENIVLDIPDAKEGVSLVPENYFCEHSFRYSVPGSTYMPYPESRDQRIGSSLSIPFTHQATLFTNQLNRVSSLAQQPIVQGMSVESIIQPSSQVSTQQLHSCLGSGSQKLVEASSLSFNESGTLGSFAVSVQSKVVSSGTGSSIISPPQYSGIQGDQKFNATPVLLPVMPIGGLHHGRLGNPVIDMTSSGYIGEPQVHFRNPNLTWLPVLPAAAAAVGATYHPPCVASDGSCYGNLTTPFVDNASYATCTSIPTNEAVSSGSSNGSLLSLETGYVEQTAERVNNDCGIQKFKPTRQVTFFMYLSG